MEPVHCGMGPRKAEEKLKRLKYRQKKSMILTISRPVVLRACSSMGCGTSKVTATTEEDEKNDQNGGIRYHLVIT